MSYLDDIEFANNPDPRCMCVLLLDTSASMTGIPIEALNQGLRVFQQDLKQDELAQRRTEVAIITFGNGGVRTIQEFVTADQFEAPRLSAGGNTPMGEGIEMALSLIRERKNRYKENGIPYYRPWIFMITDGEPTDDWQLAAQHIYEAESTKSAIFFSVGTEGANINILSRISVRPPAKLKGLNFNELFLWLSRSQHRVSASKIGEQIPLPPTDGWSMI